MRAMHNPRKRDTQKRYSFPAYKVIPFHTTPLPQHLHTHRYHSVRPPASPASCQPHH